MLQGIPLALDFFFFISGFAFVFSAMEAASLVRIDREHRVWGYLFTFFFLQGVRLLWGADVFAFGAESPTHGIQVIVETVSFTSLLFFGFFSMFPRIDVRLRIAIVLTIGAAAVGLAAAIGSETLRFWACAALGIPGSILAFVSAIAPRSSRDGKPWLPVLAAALIGFCVVAALDIAGPLFRLFSARSLMQVIGLATIIAGAIATTGFERKAFALASRGTSRTISWLTSAGVYVLMPLLVCGGWLLNVTIGSQAEDQLKGNALLQAGSVAASVGFATNELTTVARSVAATPPVAGLLSNGDAASLSYAEASLAESAGIFPSTACFVADARGRIIASSDRALLSEKTGQDIRQQSYFKEAMTGGTGMAVIVADRSRVSLYSSRAVLSSNGAAIGAAVVRRDISNLTAVTSVPDCFLVDGDGIIAIGSDPSLLLGRLWEGGVPPNGAAAGGPPPSIDAPPGGQPPATSALVRDEPSYGQTTGLYGSPALITRVAVQPAGWSVVLFSSTRAVSTQRLAGIAATLLAVLILSGFTIVAKIGLASAANVLRSESLYRTLVHSSPSWVSLVDRDGIVRFTNAVGTRALSVAEQDVVGRSLADVLGAEAAAQVAGLIDAAQHGTASPREVTLIGHGGAATVWQLRAIPLPVDDGHQPGTMLIGSDVTESREAERRLIRAERTAALGIFTAGIAHRFNNVNTAVLGYLELLDADPHLPDDLRSLIDSARGALSKSIDITSQLLPLASSRHEVDRAVLLGQVVKATLEANMPLFAQEGIELAGSTASSLPVRMSPHHIEYILRALLSNAAHAMRERPVRVVDVSTGIRGRSTFLTVRDTGVGIPKDKIGSIFTPFFSQKGEFAPPGSPLQRVSGVGLSLAVCHSLVSGHGGSIEVESRAGEGATFTVCLPSAAADDDPRRS
jgi:PAS domain S-box-containing protein